jgi:acyl-CoA synthetase (NDP forming)
VSAAERAGSLRALFHPRSIALVGASDSSGWSQGTFANLRGHGFGGPVYLVSRRAGVVHGEKAYPALSAVPGPVDLAYVMVPTDAVLPVLRDGADAGIRAYVVLTSGFGETGAGGARREEQIAAFASDRGLVILGPNGNGYINAAAGITPYGLPIPPPLLRGPVGVVLQSGALASSVLAFAQSRNIGISLLACMGNESMLSVADVAGYLVDDPDTRVIALFLESVRQPAEFARVARRALAAGKPVVALKVGRSALARHTAQAHTGALAGDDGVIDTVFRQLGVVRVRSVEDLIITAGLLAAGPLPGPRIGVVTPSGGASEIIAGIVRDPAWGLVLAVGLGGIWVEVLRDAALRVLPAGPGEIRRALGELRGAAVLRGACGAEPADLGRAADVIARIAEVAGDLGDRLESLEVNPLLVRGAHVEALDALITWRS